MIQKKLNGDPVDPIVRKQSKAVQHMGVINVQDEWSTPQVLLQQKIQHFKDLDTLVVNNEIEILGFNPTFDYASSFINHKFTNYYTLEDNALEQEWTEDGFLNPPYSEVRQFMQKAIQQWNSHGIGLLILVFAKTDTAWYHDLIEPLRLSGEIVVEFQRGRISFDEVDEVARTVWDSKHKVWSNSNSSPYGNMWIFLPPKIIK